MDKKRFIGNIVFKVLNPSLVEIGRFNTKREARTYANNVLTNLKQFCYIKEDYLD